MTKALINIFSLIFFASFLPAMSEGVDDKYMFWYGFGIGSLGTVCSLQNIDYLKKEDVTAFKEGMLEEFANNQSEEFNQEAFYQAELLVKEDYSDCEI